MNQFYSWTMYVLSNRVAKWKKCVESDKCARQNGKRYKLQRSDKENEKPQKSTKIISNQNRK